MDKIFNNTYQKAASVMQDKYGSQKTKQDFDDWYKSLPKWTEEEIKQEMLDHLRSDNSHNSN